MTVFVPFVIPGEKVEAEVRPEKAGFARSAITQLIETSPDRVEARCPYFRQCGGCHYQHIRYEQQLEFKVGILRETLRRIAKIELQSDIQVHPASPWNYRNRTRLQVRTAPDFALGYFEFGSHSFLSVRECPISSPLLNRVITRLLDLHGLSCPSVVEEIEFFANAEDEHLLAWAFCGSEPDEQNLLRWAEAVQRYLPEIIGVTFFASRRRSFGKQESRSEEDAASDFKVLAQAGAKSIPYRTKMHEFQVSAGSFFQVNRYLIDEMVSVVTGDATGDIALDLYAGVGLFSASLAPGFRHTFGVEASHTSHVDFMHNVPMNVKAVGAPAGDYLKSRPVRGRPDLVVMDPPRTGAGKAVIRSLVELGAPRMRYVSCDPSTLARDIVPLIASGYRIEGAHLFDLFPETFHIESVLLLSR